MTRNLDSIIQPIGGKILEPQQRTEIALDELGWLHCRTEVKSQYRTDDLLGFADSLAFPPPNRCVAIQTTAGMNNGRARVRKIARECMELATAWLLAENEIEVWVWRKRVTGGPDGQPYWGCRIIPVTIDDLAEFQTHQLHRDAEGEP